jgi:hypothetical protein
MSQDTTQDIEIISELPEGFAREFEAEVLGRVPQEKVEVGLRQAKLARIMRQAGSTYIPGVGQKIAEIDARLYFRMLHSFGNEENWLKDFLRDNPELCAPGYRPKGLDLRHGKSFVDGKPV